MVYGYYPTMRPWADRIAGHETPGGGELIASEQRRWITIVDEVEDAFSAVFASIADDRGRRVERMRLSAFARSVTINHDAAGARVTPDSPMLLRPLQGIAGAASDDERFQWGEEFAVLWSAAALNSSPVVNRPCEWGTAGRAAFSAVVTDQRGLARSFSPEAFSHDLWMGESGFEFHQDLDSWRHTTTPEAHSFVRSRRLPPMRGWEQVVVVGDFGLRVTMAGIGPYLIDVRSVQIAKLLALGFCVISWGIPLKGGTPIVTRVNPFPTLDECRPVLRQVCAELLEILQ